MEKILVHGDVEVDSEFPENFRKLCHHLAIAKQRRYSPQLIDYLNGLVTKAHHFFYQDNSRNHLQWLNFLFFVFPEAIRRNRHFVYVSALLFILPLIAMGIACFLNAEFIFSIMNYHDVMKMESMYNPANDKIGRERGAETDIMMFGFYIENNIGIAFRTFAGGILFGVGSVFFLIFNGLYIGAVAGHLTQIGYTDTFYSFIIGHGAFELTAIVFAGAAGLKLGYALIRPGQLKLTHALRQAGRDAIVIMFGTALMLLIAAFIEAFWSSTVIIAPAIKYLVGMFLAVTLIVYFVYCGKPNGSR